MNYLYGDRAPKNEQFVVLATSTKLDNERVLTGTANQITVTDGGAGSTVTLSLPQSIHTDADVTFDSLILDDLTASLLTATDASKKIVSVSDLTAWIAGTANQITVTDDTDGTVTLATPQDIATTSTPEFDGLTISHTDGVDIASGSDEDHDLVTVGVTDSPRVWWDESEDQFASTKGWDITGPTTVGDGGTTNYAAFASDGELTLAGTARSWKPWDVRPDAVKLPSSNPPAEDTKDAFSMLRFDRGTEESVYYIWEVPADFATGDASVRGRFEFLVENPPAGGGSNEAVVMGFEYKKLSDGDVFDFDAGTSSATITETITAGETAEIIHQTSNGTCTTTGWAVGDTVLFRFYRDATNGDDTYDNEASATDNDVWVFNFHMEYLIDKLGAAS